MGFEPKAQLAATAPSSKSKYREGRVILGRVGTRVAWSAQARQAWISSLRP